MRCFILSLFALVTLLAGPAFAQSPLVPIVLDLPGMR